MNGYAVYGVLRCEPEDSIEVSSAFPQNNEMGLLVRCPKISCIMHSFRRVVFVPTRPCVDTLRVDVRVGADARVVEISRAMTGAWRGSSQYVELASQVASPR